MTPTIHPADLEAVRKERRPTWEQTIRIIQAAIAKEASK